MTGVALKRVAKIRVSNVDKKSVEGQIPVRLCNYTDVYYRDEIVSEQEFMTATASEEQVAAFRLQPGDVIITKDSETADDIGIPAYVRASAPDLVCGYHLAIIRPNPERLDARFLYWFMCSAAARDQLSVAATGVTRFGLRSDGLGGVQMPAWPLNRQRAIAEYLDERAARIDTLISKKRSLMDRLDERIEAMVLAAVAESELAGQVGQAQEIRKLLAKRRRPGTDGQIVTAFRDGQVTARALRRAEGYTEAWTENATFQRVRRGDVVVHGLDGFAGAVGTCEADGICSPVYHVMEPLDGGDPDFYGRLLRVLATTGYLGLFAVSTRERAVDFRNWDLFSRIPIPVVPLERQREIGERIRALRPLRLVEEQSKTLAMEYRRALITALVSGELEIPGVA